jgi:hypothetical protein
LTPAAGRLHPRPAMKMWPTYPFHHLPGGRPPPPPRTGILALVVGWARRRLRRVLGPVEPPLVFASTHLDQVARNNAPYDARSPAMVSQAAGTWLVQVRDHVRAMGGSVPPVAC